MNRDRNKSQSGYISYTPYRLERTEFEIPESSFLNPIQLSTVPEETESETSQATAPAVVHNADQFETNVPTMPLNLTWSRNMISSHPSTVQNNSIDMYTDNIDYDDIKLRQKYAESAGNPNAISHAGAKGLYQIMDAAHKDYVSATGRQGNLLDPVYNENVRDWYMDTLSRNKIINEGNASDIVKLSKQLAAYNWGIGNLQRYLNNIKAKGQDIYQSLDWINGLPKETQDYIKRIALKQDAKWENSYQKYRNT